MNYIVFDLEFNQGYSDFLKQEIIEIGAVKLNEDLEILDTFSKRIRPQINKKLDWRTKKVIRITQEELSQGIRFENAIDKFKKWIGNDYILCSWALDDIFELINNSKAFGLDFLWINKFIDIQELYFSEKAISLTNAILKLRIQFKLDFHEALNDAMYTVKVLQKIKPFDLTSKFRTYDYLEKINKNKEDRRSILTTEVTKIRLHCPKCGRFIKRKKEKLLKNKAYCIKSICINCMIKIEFLLKINNELNLKIFSKYYSIGNKKVSENSL